MWTLKFTLYSGQTFMSYSISDSRVMYKEERYLQILGVAKFTNYENLATPFSKLDLTSPDNYRGYYLYVLTKLGFPKHMASPIKRIERINL